MNRACVCFATDLGYMFPSLLAAIQARQFLDAEIADVVIILFTEDDPELFREICGQKGIILITANPKTLQSHTAMYARLFLDSLLPAQYSRILYIDGDVQITASLNALIQTELPADAFCAVADPMCVSADRADENACEIQAYFASLGVRNSADKPYFNSGVLLVNRESWAEISRDALKFLTEKPELCRFQDQSALNFAGHARMQPMSMRWNFPIFLRNCGVEADIQPAIYHFMSKPKPWQGAFPPWNASFYLPYVGLLSEYPGLGAYAPPMPARLRAKYFLQQRVKWLQETVAWRFSGRRLGVLKYDKAARI
jgi:lipopolysaccharide biosynthesis glycosyltransferase